MTIARILAAILILAAAAWHSREALIVASGVIAAVGITLWRMSRERSKPEPVVGPPLEQAADALPDAEIRGNAVVAIIEGLPTSVDAYMAASKNGIRLPVFRVRVRLNAPIPFCFTVRRRQSPFAVDALVSNTPLERPAFEYELKKVPLADVEAQRYFEVAANLPRLMRRLLESGLEDSISEATGLHDFRLEELTYDGSRATVLLQSAEDPRHTPLADAAVDRAHHYVEPIETFIRDEGLEEAPRE